jgi:hypothetical protein
MRRGQWPNAGELAFSGAWVRSGAVVVNPAMGVIGEDPAALIGATLRNLPARGIEEQAKMDAGRRYRIRVPVDESPTMPGADDEAIASKLADEGANHLLATQSLAQLGVLDRSQDRARRAKLFANLDGLYAFQTSAEDAQYLVPELREGVDLHDLTSLLDHQCYVRLNARGERLSTHSVRLDPPPMSDPSLRKELAVASVTRSGRACAQVDADLEAALARIERLRQGVAESTGDGASGTGVERDGGSGGQISNPARNEHRPRRKDEPHKKRGAKTRSACGELRLPGQANSETPDAEPEPTPEAPEGDGFAGPSEGVA